MIAESCSSSVVVVVDDATAVWLVLVLSAVLESLQPGQTKVAIKSRSMAKHTEHLDAPICERERITDVTGISCLVNPKHA